MCGEVSGCRTKPPAPRWRQEMSSYEIDCETVVNKRSITHSTAVSHTLHIVDIIFRRNERRHARCWFSPETTAPHQHTTPLARPHGWST
jgi:hypothetical protein